MTVALIIISVLILFIGVYVFTPMKCSIIIKRTALEYKGKVCFGFIKIPVNLISKKKIPPPKPKDTEPDTLIAKIEDEINDIKKIYSDSKSGLSDLFSSLKRRMKSEGADIDLSINFGFEDAALTGISTGAFWGLGSLILKLFDLLLGLNKVNMNVIPDFSDEFFNIYAKIDLIIQPIHFIIILLRAVKVYKRIKYNVINKINLIKGGA